MVKASIKKKSSDVSNGVAISVISKAKSVKKINQAKRLAQHIKRSLAKDGKIQVEEEMTEAVVRSTRRRVMIHVPAEILQLAASGPGTTLGAPQ